MILLPSGVVNDGDDDDDDDDDDDIHIGAQWRRSVVKYGGQGQSGQAIKLFPARRKLSFTFIFDTSLSSLMMRNLQSYLTTV